MRKFLALVMVAVSFITAADTTFAAFSDTKYSWYKQSIDTLAAAGIVNGHKDGTFSPEMSVTRAEVLKMMLGAAKIPLDTGEKTSCFPDILKSAWYADSVCTAKRLGIAKGFDSGKFGPNERVTTLEALAFGFRAFGIVAASTGKHWYDGYQEFADANNILPTHGYTLATHISRGKTAELVDRLMVYKATKAPVSFATPGCSAGKSLGTVNTINIDGTNRSYNLYVPPNYSKTKQYGLVVAIHGRTNSNDMVQGYMGLQGSRSAGRGSAGSLQGDYIVAYPAGAKVSGGYSWSDASSVRFFDAMIGEIADAYCISRDDVFVVGHSLGAWFANKLACVRGDVITAMSAVGGPGYAGDCTGPAATMLFHRTDDPLVAYKSGKAAEANRKAANTCSNESVAVTIGPFACKRWNGCSSGNPVIWCEGYSTYGNDPHSWPTGGGGAILGWFSGM